MNEERQQINAKIIEQFLNGSNPHERVISVDIGYSDEKAKIIYHTKEGKRAIKYDYFYPFVWAKYNACDKMCGGNRHLVKDLLSRYQISVKKLRTESSDGTVEERMANGYKFIFQAKVPMSYSKFLKFFKDAGTPVFSDRGKEDTNEIPRSKDESKLFLTVTPTEQYMIETGTRLFKGYDSYDCLKRMQFDLETTSLNARTGHINQIGIRTNKGFEKILSVEGNTKEERDASELKALDDFLKIIYTEDPDIIAGYNSENFDWNFDIVRAEELGSDFGEMSKKYFDGRPIYKSQKPTTLKLGGEVETYYQTIVPDHIVIDGLHAARRAQATDSNMLKADLKYTTKYLSLNKQNRVYVPGDKINKTWSIKAPNFAFNDENGDWYHIDEKHPLKENYAPKTGRYIVERYLLDDLWETDKVEKQLNEVNFQINKIVPTGFQRASTMGTAGIWKLIILAWSFEHDLAIPEFGPGGSFTGGLSRLARTGYVSDVIKLDYNSLYPSIMLTWYIDPKVDVQGVLPVMLEYVLSQREMYKKLKKTAGKKVEELRKEQKETNNASLTLEIQHWENEEMLNDRLQNPLKVLGNSAFGSFGAENLFPLGSKDCAERITCTGRQCLRLMISWFQKLGYEPIVGDSVTYDTPLFIRRKNNIDIIPICELFDEGKSIEFEKDQYRDFSKKDCEVLTRDGWKPIEYVYKHKTDKQLRRIETKNGLIDCTEDHSLFDKSKKEVKPSNLKRGDSLEIYTNPIVYKEVESLTPGKAWLYGFFTADGSSFYGDRKQKYFSKRKNEIVEHNGKRANWKISNKSLDRLNKAKSILEEEFNVVASIKDHLKSSSVYDLVVENSEFAKKFSEEFYTSYRYKKVPSEILNSDKEIKKAFIDGFCCGDGQNDTIDECIEFGQKSKVAMAGLYFILRELNYNFRCHNRSDKPEFISFRFRNHRGNILNEDYSKRREDEVWNNTVITSKSDYVYDVSASGTFINALGMICCHNTDGFNFKLPDKSTFRYTEEHPYIGKGLSRETKEGVAYTGYNADVAEFNDIFMKDFHYHPLAVNKMGLGIDEVVASTINFTKKNYADYFPDNPYPKDVKLVGNTIKSKKMPGYISTFLDKGVRLLLQNNGSDFLNYYYDYIEKIYNYKIPLKEIASKGKIKKSIEEYKKDCQTLTKAGRPKSRQAWYELCIKDGVTPDIGDTIYYINTGAKKSESDIKRVTKWYEIMPDGTKIDRTKEVEKGAKEWKKNPDKEYKYNMSSVSSGPVIYPEIEWQKENGYHYQKEYELVFACELLDRDIIDSEEDFFCEEGKEYNVSKYIDMFNKRITPLLVCFSKEIRGKILITNPADRKYFTNEEAVLVSGEPNNPGDQDRIEDILRMEDREIEFWVTHPDWIPPFTKECGMNWEEMKEEYLERKRTEKELGIDKIREEYQQAIEKIKSLDEDELEDLFEGNLPKELKSIVELDPVNNNFVSKQFKGVVIGTIYDLIPEQSGSLDFIPAM